MPAYMNIDASKHNGTTRKTVMADFGGEPNKGLSDAQKRAYAKRKSEAHKMYDERQKEKRTAS